MPLYNYMEGLEPATKNLIERLNEQLGEPAPLPEPTPLEKFQYLLSDCSYHTLKIPLAIVVGVWDGFNRAWVQARAKLCP